MIPTGEPVPVNRVSHSATTLGDLFRRRARATPAAPAMYENRGGEWRPITWEGFHDRARRAAEGLVSLGVQPGDRVAILGPTQSPWAVLDMAAQLASAVSFGIYPQQTPEQIRYLLEHSEAKVVYVDGAAEIESVLAAVRDLPTVRAIVPWDEALFETVKTRDARVFTPGVLAGPPMSDAEIERRASAVSPDDTAILIYTSGTTGPPKGAKIAHRNILALLRAQEGVMPALASDLSLNFLPMAHAAERIFGFYGRIDTGIPTAYARSMGSVLEDLADVKPTLFGAVPRIFEKAYGKIQAELERKPPAVRRLFAWAVSVGRRATELELAGRRVPRRLRLQRAIADRLVFQRVRAAFGGRVRYFVTGAAPIARAILEFFWAARLPIYEVYGMTEATVATHANVPGATRLGTVGKVIAPMDATIAEDGEILMRGPWVFQGYLKAEEATAEMLADGWLHTGDIGQIDADGYLRITDRKKHLIITAGGKNLAPANIENAIKSEDPLISQVYAHGDRRAYVIALVAPSPLETLAWGEERALLTKNEVATLTRELIDSPASRSVALNAAMARVVAAADFAERVRAAVRRGNERLAHVEQVRRFAVIDRDFSQEMGELTPTMKVKRKAVEQLHAALIDAVYDGGGTAVLTAGRRVGLNRKIGRREGDQPARLVHQPSLSSSLLFLPVFPSSCESLRAVSASPADDGDASGAVDEDAQAFEAGQVFERRRRGAAALDHAQRHLVLREIVVGLVGCIAHANRRGELAIEGALHFERDVGGDEIAGREQREIVGALDAQRGEAGEEPLVERQRRAGEGGAGGVASFGKPRGEGPSREPFAKDGEGALEQGAAEDELGDRGAGDLALGHLVAGRDHTLGMHPLDGREHASLLVAHGAEAIAADAQARERGQRDGRRARHEQARVLAGAERVRVEHHQRVDVLRVLHRALAGELELGAAVREIRVAAARSSDVGDPRVGSDRGADQGVTVDVCVDGSGRGEPVNAPQAGADPTGLFDGERRDAVGVGPSDAHGTDERGGVAAGEPQIVVGIVGRRSGQEHRPSHGERRDEIDRVVEAPRPRRLDQQPREGRVERQREEATTALRETAVGAERAPGLQIGACRLERVRLRGVEQRQVLRALVPRGGGHDEGHQRLAVDLRRRRGRETRRAAPQAVADAGRGAARAAGPLRRAVLRDRSKHQRAPPVVVARLAHEPRVDHHAHARDGQRRLGDVRGEDDHASARAVEGAPLLGEGEPAMERHHGVAASAERLAARFDLGFPREEHEHVAGIARGRVERSLHARRQIATVGQRVARLEIPHLDGKRAPLGDQVLALDVRRQSRAVERRRHHDEALRPASQHERQQQVDVEAALVEFVEDHRVRPVEQRRVAEDDPRRREDDARGLARLVLVANDVADGVAETGALELGHAGGQRATRDAPWLDHHHSPLAPPRHLGRFARAGGGRDHDRHAPERREECALQRRDREVAHARDGRERQIDLVGFTGRREDGKGMMTQA
jgi:long-chain acyl-CoA synthetase